jgi:hypothetical protein
VVVVVVAIMAAIRLICNPPPPPLHTQLPTPATPAMQPRRNASVCGSTICTLAQFSIKNRFFDVFPLPPPPRDVFRSRIHSQTFCRMIYTRIPRHSAPHTRHM